jgi:hypothetical protein
LIEPFCDFNAFLVGELRVELLDAFDCSSFFMLMIVGYDLWSMKQEIGGERKSSHLFGTENLRRIEEEKLNPRARRLRL